MGYVIRDSTPQGSGQYLAKCARCSWAATFARPSTEEAQEDLLTHAAACRPTPDHT